MDAKLKNYFSFLLLTLIFTVCAEAQTVNLREVCLFPGELNETSGLEVASDSTIWSHNDSFNPSYVYEIDTAGNRVHRAWLRNGFNLDWEELAQDDHGNIYVGDFGNNDNMRQSLRIFKLPQNQLSQDTIDPEAIFFTYPNQHAFPPPKPRRIFDMEAMFWFNDKLYLFSKNRTDPFTGYTYLYELPDAAGTYTATLLDSFKTGRGARTSYWITAADISPNGKRIVLLSSDRMWVLTCFQGTDFFGGHAQELAFPFITQKEGIVFDSDSTIYISDEKTSIFGGKLYHASLAQVPDLPLELGPDRQIIADSIILNTGISNASHNWSTGSSSQKITVTQDGLYTVSLQLNGCSATDSVQITLLPTMLAAKKDHGIKLEIGSNPFAQQVEVWCEMHKAGPLKIAIYNAEGKEVYQRTHAIYRSGKQHFQLDLHSLSAGVYHLMLSMENEIVTGKLLKK